MVTYITSLNKNPVWPKLQAPNPKPMGISALIGFRG